MCKVYAGSRGPMGCEVWVYAGEDRYKLPPRNDLFDHSPDGFQWGYGGSGPAQLALAILADALCDDVSAVYFHQEYKREIVAALCTAEWLIFADSVRNWAQDRIDEEMVDLTTYVIAKEDQKDE